MSANISAPQQATAAAAAAAKPPASSNWHDSIDTSIIINAPSSVVYSILTAHSAYPSWNPFIISTSLTPPTAPFTPGSRLTNVICTSLANPTTGPPTTMTFSPTLTRVEPGKGFAWLGRLMVPGVFDGAHHFDVRERTEAEGGGCVLEHGEDFSGLMVWTGKATGAGWYSGLTSNTRTGFERMNEAVKARAETPRAAATQ